MGAAGIYLDRGQCVCISYSVGPDSFVTPWTAACQAPLSMGFSRQEYWSGLPFPSPGDHPNPGIEPRSPAFHADSLPYEPQRKWTGMPLNIFQCPGQPPQWGITKPNVSTVARLRSPDLEKHKKCLFFDYWGYFPNPDQGHESPEWPKILKDPFTFVALVFVLEGIELKDQDSCKDHPFIHSSHECYMNAQSFTLRHYGPSCQAPLSMELFRQEYWSGLPFPSPGDLPDPGLEPYSPALGGRFFTAGTTWKAPPMLNKDLLSSRHWANTTPVGPPGIPVPSLVTEIPSDFRSQYINASLNH